MTFKHSLCRQAAIVLAPILLILGVATFVLYALNSSKNEELMRLRAQNSVRIAHKLLSMKIDDVSADLDYLANMHEASEIVSKGFSRDTSRTLTTFSDSKKVYDQIRYLDITGMELYRVDRIGNASVRVPKQRLQFKGDRYYAAEGLTLLRNEIYISPLDLNMEHGRIELPHKPMLRFVTAVFDSDNKRRGMVILNYLGASLLKLLDEVPTNGQLMLLNKQGYWLKGGTPRQDWAFMFKDGKDITFQSLYPQEWKHLEAAPEGQVLTENGLYTFATLCLGESVQSSKAPSQVHAAGCWKIVSRIPLPILHEASRAFLFKLGMFNIPIVLLLLAGVAMLCNLRRKNQDAQLSIIEQNASFERFVPQEFLTMLGKGNLKDVELSTSVQQNVAVLFSDIRSYTTISEGMTPQEVFALLNDYFVFASRPIDQNQGFIDIFIGDALMALFPFSVEHALRAAISMRKGLRDFNEQRRASGVKPIHAGYGLHFGEATLGTIGTHKRMQTTAIGDTVNLAARIESATKSYKVDIILSDTAYELLPDPKAFLLRHIDTVRVKGKEEPVALYEAFDADPPEIAKGKTATLALFKEALAHYKAGEFEAAKKKFSACGDACPEDSLPPLYIKRCATLERIPPGPDWAGISTL